MSKLIIKNSKTDLHKDKNPKKIIMKFHGF